MIEAELNGGQERFAVGRNRPARRKSTTRTGSRAAIAERDNAGVGDLFSEVEPAADRDAKKLRRVGSKTGNVAATFERWIDEGSSMSRALFWRFTGAFTKRRSWCRRPTYRRIFSRQCERAD